MAYATCWRCVQLHHACPHWKIFQKKNTSQLNTHTHIHTHTHTQILTAQNRKIFTPSTFLLKQQLEYIVNLYKVSRLLWHSQNTLCGRDISASMTHSNVVYVVSLTNLKTRKHCKTMQTSHRLKKYASALFRNTFFRIKFFYASFELVTCSPSTNYHFLLSQSKRTKFVLISDAMWNTSTKETGPNTASHNSQHFISHKELDFTNAKRTQIV